MVGNDELWPGVVAIAADADMHCVPCAKRVYGAAVIEAVIDGSPEYEQYTDHEGNPFTVVLAGSEDLNGMCCGDCFTPLDKEDGWG